MLSRFRRLYCAYRRSQGSRTKQTSTRRSSFLAQVSVTVSSMLPCERLDPIRREFRSAFHRRLAQSITVCYNHQRRNVITSSCRSRYSQSIELFWIRWIISICFEHYLWTVEYFPPDLLYFHHLNLQPITKKHLKFWEISRVSPRSQPA